MAYIITEAVPGAAAPGVYVLDEARRTFYGPYASVEEAEQDQEEADER